ncbi:MAG: HAMP domain-containing histidine kinase [Cyclobacteriaceae bacterium]|nr:HAMP domain-containing histidine kinase [Cyclobacteriaceae bacterium]MDH5248193.1 HAMP domain-containing histidine kinase [Cyclobacteriaceae bacterium]
MLLRALLILFFLQIFSLCHAQQAEKESLEDLQYTELHDSLYQQRSIEQMTLMQAKFDSEMKDARIQLLTKNVRSKQEEIDNHLMWVYFLMGALSFMAILSGVLIHSNRIGKKANHKLSLRNREIQQQAQQLQYLNQTKDKLFSVISHDLRSPLASLKGLLDIIAIDGISREDFIFTSRKLGRNLESVQDDLDNLLIWAQSQLQGLQIHTTTLKLRPIINKKIQLFSEIAIQKEITILNEIDPSLSVLADENDVGLVVRNLLANAIKFNRQGGLIMIREKCVSGCIQISVSDTGIGMTEGEIEKLFNAGTHFSRPGTQQEKGLGIGLLISKEFIERNGGSIWATSEPEKGSTFTFSLKHDYAAIVSEIE